MTPKCPDCNKDQDSCSCSVTNKQLHNENKMLTEELNEQARLLGISAEKELALLTKVEQLERELAKAKKDARLYLAVQNACRDLPEFWYIRVALEVGAGGVTLYNDEGDEVEFDQDQEDMAGCINDAVNVAIV